MPFAHGSPLMAGVGAFVAPRSTPLPPSMPTHGRALFMDYRVPLPGNQVKIASSFEGPSRSSIRAYSLFSSMGQAMEEETL